MPLVGFRLVPTGDNHMRKALLRATTSLTLALQSAPLPAIAGSLTTITCSEPRGPRIDITPDGKTAEDRDGFTGVEPVFILDGEKPKVLTVLWGDVDLSDMVPKELLRSPKAEQFPIVHMTEEQVTAVHAYDKGVWVYTLFPRFGFGVFARHSHPWGRAIGATYVAKCRWANSP